MDITYLDYLNFSNLTFKLPRRIRGLFLVVFANVLLGLTCQAVTLAHSCPFYDHLTHLASLVSLLAHYPPGSLLLLPSTGSNDDDSNRVEDCSRPGCATAQVRSLPGLPPLTGGAPVV
jgi:hypothetical protein